jgi:hypothetical protein
MVVVVLIAAGQTLAKVTQLAGSANTPASADNMAFCVVTLLQLGYLDASWSSAAPMSFKHAENWATVAVQVEVLRVLTLAVHVLVLVPASELALTQAL